MEFSTHQEKNNVHGPFQKSPSIYGQTVQDEH